MTWRPGQFSATGQVNSVFTSAQGYATAAQNQLNSFASALREGLFTPPTLTTNWVSLPAPPLPAMPTAPTMQTITFTAPSAPSELSVSLPNINIPQFSVADPGINIPAAPSISIGPAPQIPDIAAVPVPAAPAIPSLPPPSQLALSTVAVPQLDMRESWVQRLSDIPELEMLEPTPYTYARGPKYASELLDNIQQIIHRRLQGGSGLDPAVEQAIWGRARDRETQIALGNEADIARQAEALGYSLPPGVLTAQLTAARQTYYDKLSGLSRDVAIKQAELEQQNLKDAITSGMQLEAQLIDYSYKIEQLAFEDAKTYAENAIQVYNTRLDQFRAVLSGYETYASVYKALIDGEMSKVEVYKAQLEAENTKAVINRTAVEAYKAQVEAGMAQIEIYRAQVGAAQTLVQLEQAKIGAAGEQIRAYVAQVNAETAKMEIYKTQVVAETSKADVFRARTQAFSAQVEAEAERARAHTSHFVALQQAKAGEWDGYRARMAAEGERVKALATQSSAQLDGFRAQSAAVVAQAEIHTKQWEANIKQYEAQQSFALQASSINTSNVIATRSSRLDAAKAGAQVYAQLVASAYGMMNASASIAHSSSNNDSVNRAMSVSYSYSNDTTDTVRPVTNVW